MGLFSVGISNIDRLAKRDYFQAEDVVTCAFDCPVKKIYIKTLMTGSFALDMTSEWKSLIGAVGSSGSSLIDTADTLSQLSRGSSIRQPWFGREIWQGVQPLKFSLPITLVAQGDPVAEVWLPVMGLIALTLPVKLEGKGEKITIPVPKIGADGKVVEGKIDDLEIGASYRIPGPGFGEDDGMLANITETFTSLAAAVVQTYGESAGSKKALDLAKDMREGKTSGAPVTVRVGSMLKISGCYITNVSVQFGNTYSDIGVPLSANVNVSISTGKLPSISNDGLVPGGQFMIEPACISSKNGASG